MKTLTIKIDSPQFKRGEKFFAKVESRLNAEGKSLKDVKDKVVNR